MSVIRLIMRCMLLTTLVGSTSCEAHAPQENRVFAFGPPEAEAEIRSAFSISGAMPNIRDLIQLAESRGINHEDAMNDRSLEYCDAGRNMREMSIENFYVRIDRTRGIGYNYAVVYNRNGQISCIETKHQYPSI